MTPFFFTHLSHLSSRLDLNTLSRTDVLLDVFDEGIADLHQNSVAYRCSYSQKKERNSVTRFKVSVLLEMDGIGMVILED